MSGQGGGVAAPPPPVRADAGGETLIAAREVRKRFVLRRAVGRGVATVEAVRGVSFELRAGASLGIVGESGSGKTTVARMLVGLEAPTTGTVLIDGAAVGNGTAARRRQGRIVQIVFQDPYTSLDPRQSADRALDEVQQVLFRRSAAERRARAAELLDAVGLSAREGRARPAQLSGGQRQRLAIARALAAEPRALILDEAVSALDVSVQAQILNLLGDLRRELGLAYLLISHDLAVIRQLSDDVLVMYRGEAVEAGPVEQLLRSPRHPYTRKLLDSVPHAGMSLRRRSARAEAALDGCVFRASCPLATERCAEAPPPLAVGAARWSRCWYADEVAAAG
jgi:peptide/nickel transport system ATP-binding protein